MVIQCWIAEGGDSLVYNRFTNSDLKETVPPFKLMFNWLAVSAKLKALASEEILDITN